jgi:hypothetical protein
LDENYLLIKTPKDKMKINLLLIACAIGLFVNKIDAQTAPSVSLYAIQYTGTTGPANSPFVNQTFTTGGIVTAVYGYGYYVQTTNAHAWAAINVYDNTHTVAIGDSITFSGQVVEYYMETEMQTITNFNIVSTGNPVPMATPVLLDSVQLRKYQAILVTMTSGTCVRYNGAKAWYVFTDASTGVDTVDNVIYTYNYVPGAKYTVTGVIHFEYANWIEPRFLADIVSLQAGIEEYDNFINVKVFPNPSNGLFTVSLTAEKADVNSLVVLRDLTGRMIAEELHTTVLGANTWEMNTTGLANGLYFLEVSNANGKSVERILIQ